MENHKTTLKWSELYKLDVYVPALGKSLGKVEDFFFKEDSGSIYALSVRTRLHGDMTLPITSITAVDAHRVTVPNVQVLTKAVPAHPRGQSLLARKVMDTKEHEMATVKNIILSVDPANTMRVTAFEVSKGESGRLKGFTAEGVSSYKNDVLVVDSYTAKNL